MVKTKKMKKLMCHPKIRKTSKKKDFCLKNKDLLISLKTRFNERHPDKKIKTKKLDKIHKELEKNLSGVCYEERCWIKTFYNKNNNKIIDKYFAPEYPKKWLKNKNTWLTSIDISRVMKQYEESNNEFIFLGPSPIDYNTIINNMCVYQDICELNLKDKIKKGKKKIGIIFNTDYHYESGSHWICLYIDLEKKIFFYFDSTGDKIPLELKNYYKYLNNQIKLKYESNEGHKHQYKNTECGMYCLYVIISLLTKKESFKSLKTKKIKDNEIEKYRKIYFNKPYLKI